jgi:hypothetical protein
LGLIIEVADTSLLVDSGEVLKVYACEAGPAYWIVDLPHHRISVHSEPTGSSDVPTYRARCYYGADDEVPVVLDGRDVGRIAVRDVLP